jgi:uncharacterized protein involved in outer membrane biogenesis
MNGTIDFILNASIPMHEKLYKNPQLWNVNGLLETKKLNYQNHDSTIQLSELKGSVTIAAKEVRIKNLEFEYRKSKIKIAGTLLQWLSFYDGLVKPKFIGKINCDEVNIDKLFDNQNKNNATNVQVSGWGIPFDLSAEISAKNISYKKLNVTSLKTRLKINNQQIIFDSLELKALNGKAHGEINLEMKTSGDFDCKIVGNLKQLDITELFKSFDNFEQSTLKSEHISGKVDA